MTNHDEELLTELLLQWEELYERGQDSSPEELCRDCPHLIEELRARIAAMKATNWLNNPDCDEDAGRGHAKPSLLTHDAFGAMARCFAVPAAFFAVMAGCTARQESGASTPIAGERKAQANPDPTKFKAAAAEWQNWIK